MPDDNDRVSYIRYCVQDQSIATYADSVKCQFEASIQKYVQLCEQELKREFPRAVVAIGRDNTDGVPATETKTLVYSWQEDGAEGEEAKLADKIDLLCGNLLRRRFEDWLVPVVTVPVALSSTFCEGLHPSVVRWGCTNDLLEGAFRETGIWKAPVKVLTDFGARFHNSQRCSISPERAYRMLVWEDSGDYIVSQIDHATSIILVSSDGFGHALTTPNSSYFLLNRSESGVSMIMEHFVDVEPWSYSSWSYATYCDHIAKLASRCGFTYRPRRSDGRSSSAVHGFSLERIQKLTPSATVREFVQDWQRRLSELTDMVEISLAGGPVWNEVYEKDETRFRTEILDPLLQKMNFRSVDNTHGINEHGRDFVMVYQAGFHEVLYIGLQAKAGDIVGGSGSRITELANQIDEAFVHRYPIAVPGGPSSRVYISCMIVAISGEFTGVAVESIQERVAMQKCIRGNVFFWDKRKIQSLISHYWGRSQQ